MRNDAGQVSDFVHRMDVGDVVVVPRLACKTRDHLVGEITGPYRHVEQPPPSGHHERVGKWLGLRPRRPQLWGDQHDGAILTVFPVAGRPTQHVTAGSLTCACWLGHATGEALPTGASSQDALGGTLVTNAVLVSAWRGALGTSRARHVAATDGMDVWRVAARAQTWAG